MLRSSAVLTTVLTRWRNAISTSVQRYATVVLRYATVVQRSVAFIKRLHSVERNVPFIKTTLTIRYKPRVYGVRSTKLNALSIQRSGSSLEGGSTGQRRSARGGRAAGIQSTRRETPMSLRKGLIETMTQNSKLLVHGGVYMFM